MRAYGNGKYELGTYEDDPAGAVGAEAGAVPVHTALGGELKLADLGYEGKQFQAGGSGFLPLRAAGRIVLGIRSAHLTIFAAYVIECWAERRRAVVCVCGAPDTGEQ